MRDGAFRRRAVSQNDVQISDATQGHALILSAPTMSFETATLPELISYVFDTCGRDELRVFPFAISESVNTLPTCVGRANLSDPVDIKSFASYIYIFRSTTRAVSTTDESLCRGGHVLHIHWQRRPLTLSDCPLIQPRNHQQASHPLTHRERMLESPAREEDRRELADHHHQGERQRPVLKHERAGMSVILFCAPCASRVRRAKTSVRVFGTWRPGRNT